MFGRRPRHLDARPAAVAHDACHLAQAQLCSLRLGRAHHGCGELARVDLGGGVGRAEATVYDHAIRHPIDVGLAAAAPAALCAGEAAIGDEAAIAPVAADHFWQARVQSKAAPRHRLERTAVAPPRARSRPTCPTPRTQARALDRDRPAPGNSGNSDEAPMTLPQYPHAMLALLLDQGSSGCRL
jgi:hypothetical protein